MQVSLLIMAAGMGSRFGGLKQIEGVGPSGETIMEYSVYDAIRSGFGEVVCIIRKDFEDDFRKKIVEKIEDKINVQLVYQDLNDLPEGYSVPAGRNKPWGTGHAILSAGDKVKNPFVVINADDFYGLEAFIAGIDFLKKQRRQMLPQYGLVGYALKNTLSIYGTVTRAQCVTNDSGMLTYIEE
ncbi:MAG: nucleotidyltransferase, partial [Bacteroidetes bacterium]|nr:nucleotidyltransferase [Bacteroidota bacterium]